jgi:ferredoxin-NADP reductase/mono/diheme cytochrome c family protein
MLPGALSPILGILFVVLGVLAVWLMFDASRSAPQSPRTTRMIQAHRIAGYLFVALFCLMTWFMILKVKGRTDDLPPPSLLHVLIATVLAPLLFVKLLVARYYKKHTAILAPLGLTIFVLAFVLIATAVGPYILRTTIVKDISLQAIDMGSTKIDIQASEELMQRRCSRCHTLDRVIGARKDARGWLATVDRMRTLPASGISERDEKVILSYLLSENSIDSSSTQGQVAVGKALVDSHCGRCHALDRTYKSTKTASEWSSTVTRMVQYARGVEGFFKPGEAEQIVQFLSATQTPEGAQSAAAMAAETAAVDKGTGASGNARIGAPPLSNIPTIGVLVFVFGVFGLLLLRPHKAALPAITAPVAAPSVKDARPSPARSFAKSVILELVRTERQTHDCTSLRFRIPEGRRIDFRPGQFLTFDWLLSGQKVSRSFSISSAPTQRGFVEITVKKNPKGLVSRFLNERAAPGLTVEARGPFGRFHLDENTQTRIVLIAAGSGITPMISMLRYIDDLSLHTETTLFYSVRTRADIIFASELETLEERLFNLQSVVALTQPDDGWHGPTGRISSELITKHLNDPADRAFFLCGPQPFMEHVRGILLALGVPAEKILEEKFDGGKTKAPPGLDLEAPSGQVEFVRSGKTARLSAGQTLLEAAEAIGVDIPYGCRQGQCGTCTTRLLDGEVDAPAGLDPGLKARGCVLACVTRARGDVRLDA